MSRSYKKTNYCGDKKTRSLSALRIIASVSISRIIWIIIQSQQTTNVCLNHMRFVTMAGFVLGRNTGRENWTGTTVTIIVDTAKLKLLLLTTRKSIVTGIAITK